MSEANFCGLFRKATEADFGEGKGSACPPPFFFCNHLLFCNQFEELETALFEVELIINNAPLTYVYPNTLETSIAPNHLLFNRQLLYSPNTI